MEVKVSHSSRFFFISNITQNLFANSFLAAALKSQQHEKNNYMKIEFSFYHN